MNISRSAKHASLFAPVFLLFCLSPPRTPSSPSSPFVPTMRLPAELLSVIRILSPITNPSPAALQSVPPDRTMPQRHRTPARRRPARRATEHQQG